MIAATGPAPREGKLIAIDEDGALVHRPRSALAQALRPGDLVVANDAATLPASLSGRHGPSLETIEVRLAGWRATGDPTRFIALAFGSGDHRIRTENRPAPPPLAPGDRLVLGPLRAVVEELLGHPRLFGLRFAGSRETILAGLARHGRPIQYAHVPRRLALWDIWTKHAALPVAFEPPSAGFALDWSLIAAWRRRGIGFASLTHAAGISSTGDAALDERLPFDEPYEIPEATRTAIARTKAAGGRIIAIGTTVVRALEAAADETGLRAGAGIATGRIGASTRLRVVDAILSGVHQPGESHYELLRAFADDAVLARISAAVEAQGYRSHEFGDSMLLARQPSKAFAVQPADLLDLPHGKSQGFRQAEYAGTRG